jgi:hypothetical protein
MANRPQKNITTKEDVLKQEVASLEKEISEMVDSSHMTVMISNAICLFGGIVVGYSIALVQDLV